MDFVSGKFSALPFDLPQGCLDLGVIRGIVGELSRTLELPKKKLPHLGTLGLRYALRGEAPYHIFFRADASK